VRALRLLFQQAAAGRFCESIERRVQDERFGGDGRRGRLVDVVGPQARGHAGHAGSRRARVQQHLRPADAGDRRHHDIALAILLDEPERVTVQRQGAVEILDRHRDPREPLHRHRRDPDTLPAVCDRP
jgi:hypothetical protein